MSDAVDIALRTLAITKLKVSSIISAAKADDGWRVAVELVETRPSRGCLDTGSRQARTLLDTNGFVCREMAK